MVALLAVAGVTAAVADLLSAYNTAALPADGKAGDGDLLDGKTATRLVAAAPVATRPPRDAAIRRCGYRAPIRSSC